jgi:hypothetical protein
MGEWMRACVCVRENRNEDRDVGGGGDYSNANNRHGWWGSMAQSAMLAPALLLTGSAVPIVAIRAVVGCARGDGFLCVWAEEL